MNISLLIGVSKYANLQNLSGCENDISAVSKLLELTKKYDKVTVINKNENAAKVKEQIVQFFEEVKNKDAIDELFFFTLDMENLWMKIFFIC